VFGLSYLDPELYAGIYSAAAYCYFCYFLDFLILLGLLDLNLRNIITPPIIATKTTDETTAAIIII